MAIKYSRPQSEVYQLLEITQQATGDHLAACIVGPQYDLYRYGTEVTVGTVFYAHSAAQTITYSYAQEAGIDYEVDTDSVSVYADGLQAFYGNLGQKMKIDDSNKLVVRLADSSQYALAFGSTTVPTGYSLYPTLGGTQVQVGDIFRASVDTSTAGSDDPANMDECVVEGLVGKIIAPSASTSTNVTSSGTLVATDLTVDASNYTGTKDRVLILTSNNTSTTPAALSAVTWTVTDSTGTTVATSVTIGTSATTIGTTGVTIKASAATKTVGAGSTISIVVDAAKESETIFDGVLLSNIPVDLSAVPSTGIMPYAVIGKEINGLLENVEGEAAVYVVGATSVTINKNPTISVATTTGTQSVSIADGIGSLYPQFRVLKKYPEDDDLIEVASVDEIQSEFGTIDVSNDIAYGAYAALQGSAGRSIFCYRTRGTDLSSFKAALQKSEANNELYSFVPLTDDRDIFEAFVEFNADMSAPEVKQWRRTIMGVDVPGEYTLATVDNTGARLTCTVTADSTGKFTLLQCDNAYASSENFNFKEVEYEGSTIATVPGDKIQVGSSLYTIATVSGKSVGLSDPLPTALTKAPFSVVKADTPANTIEYVGAIAQSFNTRRALVVFCDGGTIYDSNDKLVHVSNKYLAAEIAGISSAVVPQQSITRTEMSTITYATNMYTKYTQTQLDQLAVQGVLIVTQDHKNTKVYIRHQLTTEMDKGNLYYEDSCTRNLDAISYEAADIIDKYIGKANVTPTALRLIKNELDHLYTEKTAVQSDLDAETAALVGPQLINYTDLTVYQDPDFKDRVIAKVNLYLPLPMNGVRLYEMAYIATVTI